MTYVRNIYTCILNIMFMVAWGYGRLYTTVCLLQPNLLQPNLLQPNLLQPNLLQPNLLQPNLLQPNLLQPNLLLPCVEKLT